MKIAFVYDVAYPWHVGGAEAVTFNEAKGLAAGNEVHFFTMQWPEMKQEFKHEGIIYHARHRVDQSKLYRHGRRSVREALVFSFGLLRMFSYDFDVVISNYFPILDAPFVYLFCKLKGSKYIMEVAEVWDREYWKGYLGSFFGSIASAYSDFALRLADHYICISSATAEKVMAAGIDGSRVTVYCPVIEDEKLSRIRASAHQKKRVVFSGRFIKDKRLDKWIEVVGAASRSVRGLEALIIGDGPEKENLEAIIKERKLGDTIKIMPFYKDKSDFYRVLKDSGALLNMSEREGLSIIVMESVALGVPAILPDYSPIPREIKSMCVVKSEKLLPGTIAQILNSREREEYIKNIDNLKTFSASRIAEVYSKVFEKLGVQG